MADEVDDADATLNGAASDSETVMAEAAPCRSIDVNYPGLPADVKIGSTVLVDSNCASASHDNAEVRTPSRTMVIRRWRMVASYPRSVPSGKPHPAARRSSRRAPATPPAEGVPAEPASPPASGGGVANGRAAKPVPGGPAGGDLPSKPAPEADDRDADEPAEVGR